MKYEKSFNIGTIRLLNNLVTPDNWKDMKEEIRKISTAKSRLLPSVQEEISTKFSP
jgi:exopolyphosphatase/guanosine-5'-triphosphate,3'-diphosphate pyrophosphatase